jgi:hypothetical protein
MKNKDGKNTKFTEQKAGFAHLTGGSVSEY